MRKSEGNKNPLGSCRVQEKRLLNILAARKNLTRDLELVKQLELPKWCIAAGYIRNCVWDDLHNYAVSTPLNDVDILYFDPNDISEETEKQYEDQLNRQWSEYDWSVKNQARMHFLNQDDPYQSVEDAMKRWPETATAVGISLNKDNNIKVIAPYGLHDLFGLIIRMSSNYKNRELFFNRVMSKRWLEIWPKLKIGDFEY